MRRPRQGAIVHTEAAIRAEELGALGFDGSEVTMPGAMAINGDGRRGLLDRRRYSRQADGEGSPLARAAFHGDAAPEDAGDPLGDRQAETDSPDTAPPRLG